MHYIKELIISQQLESKQNETKIQQICICFCYLLLRAKPGSLSGRKNTRLLFNIRQLSSPPWYSVHRLGFFWHWNIHTLPPYIEVSGVFSHLLCYGGLHFPNNEHNFSLKETCYRKIREIGMCNTKQTCREEWVLWRRKRRTDFIGYKIKSTCYKLAWTHLVHHFFSIRPEVTNQPALSQLGDFRDKVP